MGDQKDESDINFDRFSMEREQKFDSLALQLHKNNVTLDVESESDQSGIEDRSWLEKLQSSLLNFINSNKQLVKCTAFGFVTVLYFAYLITAMILDFQRALALVVITAILLTIAVYYGLKRLCGNYVERRIVSPLRRSALVKDLLKWYVLTLLLFNFMGVSLSISQLTFMYRIYVMEKSQW